LAAAPNAEDNTIRANTRALLEEALNELEPRSWAVVLRAYYLEGKQYPEITETTGIPIGSVCSMAARGTDRLREWFDDRGYTLDELLPPMTVVPAPAQRRH
jgi:RNA polymerase sigma factor (sigma-70 family)